LLAQVQNNACSDGAAISGSFDVLKFAGTFKHDSQADIQV